VQLFRSFLETKNQINPLTPTVAVWVQLQSQTGLSQSFVIFDTRSGTGCFVAVPIWQQSASKG